MTNRSLLVRLAGLLLVFASPASAQRDDALADNVVVVLDASGSMRHDMPGSNQSKMEVAKQSLTSVLGGLPPETRVGVLVFSGRGKSQDWVVPLGPLDLEAVGLAVAPIRPDGGTPLGGYMRMAAEKLLSQRDAQSGYGTFRILVVTDGEASDPEVVESATPSILARGVTVDVIGVNMEAAHTLATSVHSYRRADREDELEQALAEVFAEVGSDPDSIAPDEAYAEIASLPDGAASEILATLRRVRQSGTRSEVGAGSGSGSIAAAPSGAGTGGGAGSTPASSGSGSGGVVAVFAGAAGLLVAVLFLGVVLAAIKKNA